MDQSTTQDNNEWTLIENKELRELHSRGKTIRVISCKLRRTDSEIISQLVALGIYGKKSDEPKTKEPIATPSYLPPINQEQKANHTITVKTKAFTEPIKKDLIEDSIIDEESVRLWKYRNQRSEQVQLMKELVSAIEHTNLINKDILMAINKNTVATNDMEMKLEKLIQYIEDATAGRLLKKKNEAQEQKVQKPQSLTYPL